MTGKRHSAQEIIGKLRQADEMMEEGRRQGEIAHALGISVMTYHRWRKARPHLLVEPKPQLAPPVLLSDPARARQAVRVDELRLENERLRRLVADLMLEIVQLEELQLARGAPVSARFGRPD
jgi:hypothetical protein